MEDKYGLFIVDEESDFEKKGADTWAGAWFTVSELEKRIAEEVLKIAEQANVYTPAVLFQIVDKDLKVLETLDAVDLYDEEQVRQVNVCVKDIQSALSRLGKKKRK